MKQEEKILLLKDLCARLAYQPICEFMDTEDDFCTATAALGYSLRDFIAGKVIIKPYLRPMETMTEDEREEYENLCLFYGCKAYSSNTVIAYELIDWLISHHFDCRGLIPMCIALEAPEGMYKIN